MLTPRPHPSAGECLPPSLGGDNLSLASIGDRTGAYPPVLVEGFDRITQRTSRGDKSDVNKSRGIWCQGRDYLLIPINSIAFFAIGAIRPGKVHRHGGAANRKFACVIID
jgi:hypothetical protein